MTKLKENKKEHISEDIKAIDNNGENGIYKGYNFYIDSKTYEVILENKNNNTSQLNDNYIILNGGTYIDTKIQQEQLILENQEFTIATRIYINKEMQSKIQNMDILGNHYNEQGIAWQFKGTDTNLFFIVRNSEKIKIDYTPYYEKWTNIVMTYKQGNIKIYIDNELKITESNMEFIPYNNFYIGTAYLGEDRAMVGAIRSVKIWKKELSQEDINIINYDDKNTTVEKENILKEINFVNDEEMLSTIKGEKYDLVPIEKNIGYNVKLSGNNYLDINLPESTMIENSEFTIAARVKINKNEQNAISHMGILGNHDSYTGIAWQFEGYSNILDIVYGENAPNKFIKVDYTPYYDKITDIVVTYGAKKLSLYINNEEIGTNENINIVPKGNLCIGSSYNDTSRGMSGELPYVKIWNKCLTKEQIKDIKMNTKTEIEKTNILRELDLTDIENFNKYGVLANHNYKLIMVGK